MIASSKVLNPAAEERSPAAMHYPIQRPNTKTPFNTGGELIHNSVGGAIVTGFLGLNDRENRRQYNGDGQGAGTVRGGLLGMMAGELKKKIILEVIGTFQK